jgi:Lon protease-like protein
MSNGGSVLSSQFSEKQRQVEFTLRTENRELRTSYKIVCTGDALSSLLPIFPLELVLLPGTPLPLHIFEPRYKEMIAECLEQKKPFGVLRASSDGVADIGCTAEIMSVTKKYDDGRMDILTRGVERFEVLEVNQDRSFLQAEISLVEDELDKPPAQMVTQAVRLHAEIAKLAGAEPSGPDEHAGNLSFLLAGSLPLDLDFKQTLLSTLSETKRLDAVVKYLEAVLPGLRRAAKARWN